MSSIIRSFVSGGITTLVALVAFVAPTQAESPAELQAILRKATRAAISGPETKVKINGHEFVVKQASVSTKGNVISYRGTISHQLSFRPDDQMYYTILKSEGQVVSVRYTISRGGLAPIVGTIAANLGPKYASDGLESFLSSLGKQMDGSWESAGKLIVTSVSLKAPSSRSELRQGNKPYQPKPSQAASK